MTEYVTKERAQDFIIAAAQGNSSRLACMLSKLEDEPAADVVEVVHARWEWITENLYKCSHCHTKTLVDEFLNETLYMYCPYCGAKVNGGESDE